MVASGAMWTLLAFAHDGCSASDLTGDQRALQAFREALARTRTPADLAFRAVPAATLVRGSAGFAGIAGCVRPNLPTSHSPLSGYASNTGISGSAGTWSREATRPTGIAGIAGRASSAESATHPQASIAGISGYVRRTSSNQTMRALLAFQGRALPRSPTRTASLLGALFLPVVLWGFDRSSAHPGREDGRKGALSLQAEICRATSGRCGHIGKS